MTQQGGAELQIRDTRTVNRFFVDNAIVLEYGPRLGAYGLAVYMALCVHAGKDTQQCWPTHRTLAAKVKCSVRQVKRSLDMMEEMGLISVQGQLGGDGQRTANVYTLLRVSAPETGAHDSQTGAHDSQTGAHDSQIPTLPTCESEQKQSLIEQSFQAATPPEPSEPEPPAPAPAEKKRKPGAKPESSFNSRAWISVLAEVCALDMKLVGARLGKRGKELAGAGYRPEQVRDHYTEGGWWYKQDWRGKKGQPPTPEQIIETIAQAMAQPRASPSRKLADGTIIMPG